jgi:hypothetical protein
VPTARVEEADMKVKPGRSDSSEMRHGASRWATAGGLVVMGILGVSGTAHGDPAAGTRSAPPTGVFAVTVTANPLEEIQTANVRAVIQVTSADSHVTISSPQLQSSCGGTIAFENLQGGSTASPHMTTNTIDVVVDHYGNATVLVSGSGCQPGFSVIDAAESRAPHDVVQTTLTVMPPSGVNTPGTTAFPGSETASGS